MPDDLVCTFQITNHAQSLDRNQCLRNLKFVEASRNLAPQMAQELKEARAELELLRKLASLCIEEIDHGFDLPSDVFDATEEYRDAVKRVRK